LIYIYPIQSASSGYRPAVGIGCLQYHPVAPLVDHSTFIRTLPECCLVPDTPTRTDNPPVRTVCIYYTWRILQGWVRQTRGSGDGMPFEKMFEDFVELSLVPVPNTLLLPLCKHIRPIARLGAGCHLPSTVVNLSKTRRSNRARVCGGY
jgi:hypothetical protein